MAANMTPSSFPTWETNYHKYTEEIGSGGFGKVYKAQGLYDQKTYAVKQISVQEYQKVHNNFEKDRNTWKSNLLHEVVFLTKLESEFVMRYYGCGFHGPHSQNYLNDQEDSASEVTSCCISTDWFYIKMEFCEEDLRKWIDKNNLEEREPHKISIINQILKGLDYIHRQQVIHRDIKPANIMLKKVLNSKKMNSFQVKIGDFGLSKLVEVSSDTLDSVQVGTRIYMSPEMSLGSKYSYKTDIYSAGLVFFEMLNPTLSKAERDKIFNEFIRNGKVIVFPTTENSQNEVKLIQNMTKMNEDERPGALELLLAYEEDTKSWLGYTNKMEGPCNTGFSPSSSSSSRNLSPLQMSEGTSGPHDFKTIGNHLKWPISYGVTSSAQNFWGRKKQLEQLESFFSNNKKLVLICGIGGIGKTELSRKFIDKIKKYGYNNCFTRVFLKIVPCNSVESPSRVWLHGDTLQSFQSSVSSFASKLGVANDKATPSEMFKYLTEMILEQTPKLVVVIDNVDTKIEEVSKCIKLVRDYENIFMIVTSRNKMILDNAGETMLLDVLSQENARNMLRDCIENISNSDADLLCELVQNYPLALQQAVAYIKEQREHFESPTYSVSDYVKEFEDKKLEMLDKRLNEFEHDYALTTLVTWDVTFDKLSEAAVELLKIFAFLDPDFIQVEFCKCIYVELHLKEGFEVAVNLLRKYSLIKVEGLRISIHRLVQEVMKQKTEIGFLKQLFHLILVDFSKEINYKFEGILKRICSLTYGFELTYPDEYLYNYKYSWDPNDRLNCIRSTIALELSKKNKNEDALELCVEVLRSKYRKEMYFKGFETMFRIYKSNPTLVVQCLENLLESRKSIFGEDHKITTIFKLALTAIYNHNGKTEKFPALSSQVKSYYDENQPLDDVCDVLLLTNLVLNTDVDAFELYSSDTFRFPHLDIEYLERLLQSYKNAIGKNDVFTLKIKNEIADIYCDNEEYDKCLEILEQNVNLKTHRGEIPWEMKLAYITMSRIGGYYYTRGKYEEARDALERFLQLNPMSYDSCVRFRSFNIRAKEQLADTLVALGTDLEQAKKLYYEILPFCKKYFWRSDVKLIKQKIKAVEAYAKTKFVDKDLFRPSGETSKISSFASFLPLIFNQF